jgi:DNA sulfur modification protein DndD
VLLRRVEIENFRSYKTPTVIELQKPNTRKVYLVGGRTGSGKTTLFGALQLCLFGRFACEQFSVANSSDMLFQVWGGDRCERSPERAWTHIAETGGYKTRIALTYADENDREYQIERLWQYRLGRGYAGRAPSPRVDEQVLLYENGELLTGFTEEEIQRWIELEIPPTTSRFFFFDGEQIQRFANEEAGGDNLKQSIEILLGIDRFRQLREDISSYVIKQIGSEPIETVEGEELKIRAELKTIEGDLARVDSSIDELQNELRDLSNREKKLKNDLSTLLSSYDPQQQDQRDQLVADAERTQLELQQVEETTRTKIQDNLAYQFLYEPLTMVLEAAEQEQNQRQRKEVLAELERIIREGVVRLKQRGNCACGARIASDDNTRLEADFLAVFQPFVGEEPQKLSFSLATLISNPERIRKFVDEVALKWEDIGQLCSQRDQLATQLASIDTEVRALSPDPDLQRRYLELDAQKSDVMGQHGRRRSDLEKLKRDRERLDGDKRGKQKELEFASGRLAERRQLLAVKRKAETIATMLNELVDRLGQSKLSELESFTSELYNSLQAKSTYRGKIRFNPDDYTSSIELPSGQVLRKSELSAGEKEVYAISLLGGLCRAANRSIPIIIDTPLSRLDRDNRRNIVQKYYPQAGKQVILLSTNEEVYGQYYEYLKEFIVQQFLLEYDEQSKSTRIKTDTYF